MWKITARRNASEAILLYFVYCKVIIKHGTASGGIAGFADLEDLSSYNEKRYYITSRESKLFEQVSKMHKVSLTLMEKQIPYLNATLLYGESGVGKTAFSRYTAYKLGLPYLYINFSRLIESHLGKTSKNISHLFDFIKKNQCLVMFDRN